jgi:hypothetical protein
MKKIAFAILMMCLGISAGAQKVFFIYLQSENRTPFYIRLADKVHSSSTSGYLILSSLKDSTYTLSVGYPGAKVAETRFAIPIESSDKGFLLKEFDGTPGLFDLQTMMVYKPVTTANATGQTISRTDPFTKKLAQAADDESLLTVPVVAKTEVAKPKVQQKEPVADVAKVEPKAEEKKELPVVVDTVAVVTNTDTQKIEEKAAVSETPPVVQKEPETKQDTTIAVQPEPVKQEIVQERTETPPVAEEPYRRSVVTRRSESSTTEGFGLVYLDTQNGSTDTIRLLIPNPKRPVKIEDTPPVVDTQKQVQSDVQTKDPTTELTIAPEKKKNSCNNIATEKDFLKLRKNMAAETNDEEMIAEARKYFKTKCFTTEQVRYLSTLFLTNAAKYQFFDAAYQHVSDLTLFPSLGSEIKDEYYTKRFKALIGE